MSPFSWRFSWGFLWRFSWVYWIGAQYSRLREISACAPPADNATLSEVSRKSHVSPEFFTAKICPLAPLLPPPHSHVNRHSSVSSPPMIQLGLSLETRSLVLVITVGSRWGSVSNSAIKFDPSGGGGEPRNHIAFRCKFRGGALTKEEDIICTIRQSMAGKVLH